jgi:hypothetical protein
VIRSFDFPDDASGRGTIRIPDEGTLFDMWFEYRRGDCHEFDSDFERNYLFPMRPYHPVLLEFGADGATPDDVLAPGDIAVVRYDPARHKGCAGVGGEWQINAGGLIDDGLTFFDERIATSLIDGGKPRDLYFQMPGGASELQLWFEKMHFSLEGTGGFLCDKFDSRNGKNYRFAIE